jgi:hypothetical protein
MSNELVVKAASLIRAGDIAGAEFALVSLAESDGDHALVAVLEQMPPKDLLAVIREFDASRESVVSLVVTPEQFARALVMERLYGDHTHTHLRGMVNAVLFRDDNQSSDFLEAIGEIDGGCEALVDYLCDRDEAVVHFANYGTFNHLHSEEGDEIDKSEASDHDWKELTWLLKHDHPDMFEQILPQLKIHLTQRLKAEAELEMSEQGLGEALSAPPMMRPAAGAVAAPTNAKKPHDPSEESAL